MATVLRSFPLAVLALFARPAWSQLQPYCVPTADCWPKDSEWASLNSSVSGRLIALHTPTCTGTSVPALNRTQDPSCTLWDVTQHDHCDLKEPLIAPTFAVHVADKAHVQNAVKFALKYNIRVTVKTTGHDFVGRSTASDGLLIWLEGFNKVEMTETYDDSCTKAVPAVTAQGGAIWLDVYPVVQPKYHAVGGNSLSVSVAGGFMQGGGHSVLSPSLGLAVDSVLSMEVVTMDGSVQVASPCQNTDLFFALRGGGGGTYGIVTSISLQLHEVGSGGVVGLDVILPLHDLKGGVTDVAEAFFETYIAMQTTIDPCWGGYLLTGDAVMDIPKFPAKIQLHLMCNADMATASSSMKGLQDWFNAAKAKAPGLEKLSMIWVMKEHTSFWDWHGTAVDPVGGNSQIASHIVPKENFAIDFKAKQLAKTVLTYGAGQGLGSYIIQLGGAVATKNSGTSATTHGYRRGQWHVVHVAMEANEAGIASLTAFQKELHAQAPLSGAYFNEMFYYEPNWQHSFFGEHYLRLLTIKKKYDPAGLLSCHHCVGNRDDGMNATDEVTLVV
eukprot:gb/GFBE01018044.1/.p1 GENE.gb/GFBE01018044.1/~~gb/GFBE01018044.1/.p1  ORF type:complete len:556 (+),score=136.97 gb/GFBE01018044.1/:1-1668(+)